MTGIPVAGVTDCTSFAAAATLARLRGAAKVTFPGRPSQAGRNVDPAQWSNRL